MDNESAFIALTGDPLDRCDALRKQAGSIEAFRAAPDGLYLVLQGDEILLQPDGTLTLVHAGILPMLEIPDPGPVFLGVEQQSRRPWFVIAPNAGHAAGQEILQSLGEFSSLRQVLATLPGEDLAIAGRSFSLLQWHATHQFCAGCGGNTNVQGGGEKRLCPACAREHFPRVDPAVIMLVTHQDQCLLGRNANWPAGQYSTLAGFVEPGESIEEACRREIREEVAVDIGKVTYAFSQPWPFPHSMMIALNAEALSTDIVLEDELEDARWFSRAEIQQILTGDHPNVLPPYPRAASGVLLRNWAK